MIAQNSKVLVYTNNIREIQWKIKYLCGIRL